MEIRNSHYWIEEPHIQFSKNTGLEQKLQKCRKQTNKQNSTTIYNDTLLCQQTNKKANKTAVLMVSVCFNLRSFGRKLV